MNAVAHYESGNALYERGRMDDAVAAYREALRLKPDYSEAHNNLGAALQALGRREEAIAAYREAVRLQPDYVTAWSNLGSAVQLQGDLNEAISAYRQALRLNPNYAMAHYNLGNVLRAQRRPAEAIDAFRAAVELKPDFPEAHSNLGAVLHEQERLEEALAAYQEALRLKPDWGSAAGQIVHLLRQLCRWDDLAPRVDALRHAIMTDAPLAKGIPPFSIVVSDTSEAEQLRCARQWVSHKRLLRVRDVSRGPSTRAAASRDGPSLRLRIGYLSADFHEHATAYLIAGLLEAHDREAFEIAAYSSGPDDASPMRRRLRSACSRFVEIGALSDQKAAACIQADGIDILVDLKGYTQHARTGILTYRPAPIQAQFLGYPGTMGTRLVDYLIADRFVVPEAHFRFYDEHVIHLPDCYQPNDPHRLIGPAPSRTVAGLPEAGMVLCSFNETYKITPTLFDIWMRLLQSVQGSVLWLLASNRWAPDNLRAEARLRGVDPRRLIFAPRVSPASHLGRLTLADLVLDTLPCNGHTTTSDALWCGVPVLTCPGETFASRVAGSLLQAMGLPELITDNLEQYERRARELAEHPEILAGLKTKVQEARRTSPLFDAARFARHLEAAYQAMWERHAGGKGPAAISIAPAGK
ncbi:MAG TPA: tetratricopeptide repeat protein [Terriglobia bacterium]|nr:tetratricopeptide repeat protein [Terriglobia bacterium]